MSHLIVFGLGILVGASLTFLGLYVLLDRKLRLL